MRKFIVAATLASLVLPLAPAMAQPNHFSATAAAATADRQNAQRDRKNAQRQRVDRRSYRQYDFNRPDPRYGNYQAERYYDASSKYRTRRLSANDRIYRGQDNRYYCRRSDGTTGLILGALAGGLFGNAIASGDSRTLGTLLGAGAGAAIGSSVGRNQKISCR